MLRISTPQAEGVMQVSKALKIPVLLDDEEMRELFKALGHFLIYDMSRLVGKEHGRVDKEVFLEFYSVYIKSLKEGLLPDESLCKPLFSSIFTSQEEVLFAMPVGDEKYLIKSIRPVVQLQTHHLFFSKVDEKFYSLAQGKDTITWGIQFSYPQIFQDPKSKEFKKTSTHTEFTNTPLFLALSRFVRQNTLPTPLIYQEKQTNLPVRLGKRCFSWIANHPQLLGVFTVPCPSKLLPSAMSF